MGCALRCHPDGRVELGAPRAARGRILVTPVLFWVQHLLGSGHLKRAATLARAMSERGPARGHRERRDAGALARRRRRRAGPAAPGAGAAISPSRACWTSATGRSTTRFRALRRDRLLALFQELRPRVDHHRDVPVRPARVPVRARAVARGGRACRARGPGGCARCATCSCASRIPRATPGCSRRRALISIASWRTPIRS